MIRAALAFIVVATLANAFGSTFSTNTQMVLYQATNPTEETCLRIEKSVSNASQVYYPMTKKYTEDIHHWAKSSTQFPECSFEPGTPGDVGIALQILGETKTPFAVKGGGHIGNPGFSSTPGVQIAMSRFCNVDYDPTTQTVTLGAGQIWDDVYAELERHGVNVVGGRVSGVGVAGFILGGGYSWLTNQYGLTIDTVQAYELVLPNGTVTDVTETSSPDLFFALKGGLNNFGIVTKFRLKAFSQTQVWGGRIDYNGDSKDVLAKINQATVNFARNNKDPKAAVITTYNAARLPLRWRHLPVVLLFYNAPTPPVGVFDEFLSIRRLRKDIGTQSFSSFVQSLTVGLPPTRVIFNSISVTDYSVPLLELIANEIDQLTKTFAKSACFIGYDPQFFLPTLLTHGTPSAYPPDRTHGFFPVAIYFAWPSPEFDQVAYNAIRESAQKLQVYAIEQGLSDPNPIVYPNYAIFDTPFIKMYGANVARLQAIKEKVDPENVMGLAGGFKF